VDEAQALVAGTASKRPETSLPLPEEEVRDKAKRRRRVRKESIKLFIMGKNNEK